MAMDSVAIDEDSLRVSRVSAKNGNVSYVYIRNNYSGMLDTMPG